MIFFRIRQAIPGGILPVVCMSMLYAIVPREKIGSAGAPTPWSDCSSTRRSAAVPATAATTPAEGAVLVADAALTPEPALPTTPAPLEPAVPHHRGAESGDPHADPRVTVGAAYRGH